MVNKSCNCKFCESFIKRLNKKEGPKKDLLLGCVNYGVITIVLGISCEELRARRKAGEIIAFFEKGRGYYYPLWQIEDGQLIKGLDKVLKALGRISDWDKALFLVNESIMLDSKSPLRYIQEGRGKEVIFYAKQYCKHVIKPVPKPILKSSVIGSVC